MLTILLLFRLLLSLLPIVLFLLSMCLILPGCCKKWTPVSHHHLQEAPPEKIQNRVCSTLYCRGLNRFLWASGAYYSTTISSSRGVSRGCYKQVVRPYKQLYFHPMRSQAPHQQPEFPVLHFCTAHSRSQRTSTPQRLHHALRGPVAAKI